MRVKKIVVVSLGADPIHPGHIRNILSARKLGYRLIVILSRDTQLIKKKGYVFMNQWERREILESIRGVDRVILSIDKDITSNETLKLLKPSVFAKGGDRTPDNMPQIELDICKEIGCKIVYGVGGGKIQSSSSLVDRTNLTILRMWY